MTQKYPYVYQDKKGHWYYQVFVQRDDDGKQHYKKGRKDELGKPFSGPRAAYRAALKAKAVADEEAGKANYRITLGRYIDNVYMPNYRGKVEESTFATRMRVMEIIKAHLGNHVMSELTARDCESFRTYLVVKSGYSQSYASLVYTTFRQLMKYAQRMGVIRDNVSIRTKAVSKGKSVQKYWTSCEFEKVIQQVGRDTFYERMVYVCLLLYYRTGIRVSEGLALTWDDVDWEQSRLRVFHTLNYTNKRNYTIKPYTKTESGMRIISLDSELMECLKRWRADQQRHGNIRFIISYDGAPLLRSTLSRILKRYARLAGVKEIDAKGLRHSHASYLIAEMNCDVLTVSQRLGHSSPDITLRYYAHMFPRNDRIVADKLAHSMNITPAKSSRISFNGNQNVKMSD